NGQDQRGSSIDGRPDSGVQPFGRDLLRELLVERAADQLYRLFQLSRPARARNAFSQMRAHLRRGLGRKLAIEIGMQCIILKTELHSSSLPDLAGEPDKLPASSCNQISDVCLIYAKHFCNLPIRQTFMFEKQATAHRLLYFIERSPCTVDLVLTQQDFIRLSALKHLCSFSHKRLITRPRACVSAQHIA